MSIDITSISSNPNIAIMKKVPSQGDLHGSDIKEYILSVFTWNLAGRKPDKDINFSKIFASQDFVEAPHIVVTGFQEMYNLSVWNVFKKLKGKKAKEFGERIAGNYFVYLSY